MKQNCAMFKILHANTLCPKKVSQLWLILAPSCMDECWQFLARRCRI